jgi:hypothetical protein
LHACSRFIQRICRHRSPEAIGVPACACSPPIPPFLFSLHYRADRLLRFSKELSFLVTTGRQADTALWYQRLTAAASAAAQQQAASNGGPAAAKLPWAATFLFGKVNNTTAESTVDVAQPAAGDQGAGRGSISGVAGGAAFLAAALEGSSNSSRLDAKLAVS